MSPALNQADIARIIGTPHQVVRASAGSGKTYTLAVRYIALLRVGATPDTILATTFTRKAAGEILERVLQRLAGAALNGDEARRLGADLKDPALTQADCIGLLATVCRGLHRVSISTLDSFFHRVATCFCHELGVPARFTVADQQGSVMTRLRRRAIEAALADEADNNFNTLKEMVQRLSHNSATRSITGLIGDVVSGDLYDVYRLNPQQTMWSRLIVPPGLLSRPALAEAINALRDLAEQMPNKTWANGLRGNREAAQGGDWVVFLKGGIANGIVDQSKELKFARRAIPEGVIAVYEPLIAHARAELIGRVARQTVATHQLLACFDGHYTRLRHEAGALLYNDLPFKLAGALARWDEGSLFELYYRLDARVTHLLLDEFQDTSLEQWGIIEPFAREILAHGDGSRTFFCVGDVKQAIYGWRGGCAEIFDQIERALSLDREAEMNVSYRSSQVVLDTVNQVFGSLDSNPALDKVARADVSAWQDRFAAHTAYQDKPGYVELVASTVSDLPDSPEDDDDEESSTRAIAGSHEAFVADKVDQIIRNAPGQSVGVLVNANKTAAMLIDLLRRRGLSVSGEGGTPLTDDPAVGLVLSAMVLADHPADTAAAFHVANSPLGPIVGLNKDQFRRADRVAGAIRQSLLLDGYAGVITRWSRRLGSSCSERNVERLSQLIELADRHDHELTLRPSDFVALVENTAVEEPSPALVRVMTINKSKGLEFDAVVLPELERALYNESKAMVYVQRDPPAVGPVSGVFRAATKEVRVLSRKLQTGYEQRVSLQFHDDLSKLYVAMTRARHGLYMIVKPLKRIKSGEPGAAGWSSPSFAALLRRELSDISKDESSEGGQTLYSEGEPDWSVLLADEATDEVAVSPTPHPPTPVTTDAGRLTVRFPKTAIANDGSTVHPRRSWRRVSPSSLEPADRLRVEDLLMIDEPRARARGSLIHAWFEQVEWLGPDGASVSTTDEQLAAVARTVTPDLCSGNDAWVRRLMGEFRQMLTRPEVIGAMAQPTEVDDKSWQVQLWREHAFAVRLDDELLQGRFDRVVVFTRDGKPQRADVIDFKTDAVTPQTLDTAARRYRPQIEAYRKALSVMLRLDAASIRARLLFVQTGDCVGWQPGQEGLEDGV